MRGCHARGTIHTLMPIGDDRVDRLPPGDGDHDRGDDHADRSRRVGQRFGVRALHRQARPAHRRAASRRRPAFTTRPHDRDHEHRARLDVDVAVGQAAGSPRRARSPRPRTAAARSRATRGSRAGTARRCARPRCVARLATTIAPSARPIAAASVSMWPASESRASEPATKAVTASTTTKTTVSANAIREPADAALPRCARASWAWAWRMARHAPDSRRPCGRAPVQRP